MHARNDKAMSRGYWKINRRHHKRTNPANALEPIVCAFQFCCACKSMFYPAITHFLWARVGLYVAYLWDRATGMSKRKPSSESGLQYRINRLKNLVLTANERIADASIAFWVKIERCVTFLWEKIPAKRYGFPIAMIVTIAFIYVLKEALFVNPFSSYSNILTALSQSSAAILAIMFTLLLVVGQLATSYSPRMFGRVFTKVSISYMILFLILVILPLATLAVPNDLWLARIWLVKSCFFLAVLSLSLFIPYLLYIKDRLNPENLLDELAKRIQNSIAGKTKISKETSEFVLGELSVMQHLIISAIRSGDYGTCNTGIMILNELSGDIPANLILKEYGVSVSLSDFITSNILDIGLTAIPDPIASSWAVKALRPIRDLKTLKKSLFVLRKMGEAVVKNGFEKTAIEIAYNLAYVGNIAINAAMEKETTEAISGLRDLSSDLLEIRSDWEKATKQSVEALDFLGVKASEKIKNTYDESTKELLRGKVRRVIEELGNIWNRATQADLYGVAHVAAYRIGTVSRMAIKAGFKSEIWPKGSTKLAINILSKIAVKEFRRGEKGKQALLASCRSLQMLGLEASNSLALKEIVILTAQRLEEIEAEIVQSEGDEELVAKIDYYLKRIRKHVSQRGWGENPLATDLSLELRSR